MLDVVLQGRDLTDKLWKNFFEKQFGTNSTNEVIKRMKEKKVSFKWVQLYEAKGKEMTQTENEALDRIKQLYKKEDASMILVPVFFNVFLVFLLCLGKVASCAFVYIVLLLINMNS